MDASSLVRTNHQTAPLCKHDCPCSVVQSIEQLHWLHGHYLRESCGADRHSSNTAPGFVRCGRRQRQAWKVGLSQISLLLMFFVQSAILHSVGLIVVFCSQSVKHDFRQHEQQIPR